MADILTVDEVAAILKVSRRSVYELTRERGQRGDNPLPTVRLNGKTVRFDRADVMAWIDSKKERAA